ncbi:MAG: glycoside hydrolase family 15 protein [Burkholderiaceae bacterium]
MTATTTPNLDVGIVGNCTYGALIDMRARVVWCCLPRFDSNPVFMSLLTDATEPTEGVFMVDMAGYAHSEQSYVENTGILRTCLYDEQGNGFEVIDFAPRFFERGRTFRPRTFVRIVRPLRGAPRVRVNLTPRGAWGAQSPTITHGSNHIRYVLEHHTLRLTTDAPVDYVLNQSWFRLDRQMVFVLGPDETLSTSVGELANEFLTKTELYWRTWTRRLAVPLEYQEAVIRAAITLKMCVFEETGAIIAAMTTSIPEAPNSERNWDYRYCWLRDAFFVVRALNRLAEVGTMEDYLRWLDNVVDKMDEHRLQPLFGIGLEEDLVENIVDSLPGYRGMGPVRTGNQAYEHFQHDVYGNVVLGAAQAFLDRRLLRRPGTDNFLRLEQVGERALKLYNAPDAGMWELRTRARVHTSSSLMCWAACDRLAKIADVLGLADRAAYWAGHAAQIRETILRESWSEKRQAFVESFGGDALDASVLLMAEVGIIDPKDPRFVSTVRQLEAVLADGPHMRRYEAADDFGAPETSFTVCAFWRIDALAQIGERERAREIFESMLAARNHLGLLSEDVDPRTGELWGNFPQTYSMVGIINGAMRLSRSWDSVV